MEVSQNVVSQRKGNKQSFWKNKKKLMFMAGSLVILAVALFVGISFLNAVKADIRSVGYGGCTSGDGAYGYSSKLPDPCNSFKSYSNNYGGTQYYYKLNAYLNDYNNSAMINTPLNIVFGIKEVDGYGYGNNEQYYTTSVEQNTNHASVNVPVTPGKIYHFEAYTNDDSGHTIWVMKNTDSTFSRYQGFTASLDAPPPTVTHDLGITQLNAKPNPAKAGSSTNITYSVKNFGTENEQSFILTLSYNGKPLKGSPIRLGPINPGQTITGSQTFKISKSTKPGDYIINGSINQITGETNLSNNSANLTIRVKK